MRRGVFAAGERGGEIINIFNRLPPPPGGRRLQPCGIIGHRNLADSLGFANLAKLLDVFVYIQITPVF